MELVQICMRKHPYVSIFLAWLYVFCVVGRFQIDDVSFFNYISVIICAVGLIFAERTYIRKKTEDKAAQETDFKKTSILVGIVGGYTLLTLIVFSIIPYSQGLKGRSPLVLLAAGLLFTLAVSVYLTVRKKWTHSRKTILLFILGMALHLYYNLYVGYLSQWDLGEWSGSAEGTGHLGYIEYLYTYGIPAQFDPREVWQFYHPPLSHALSALLLRIQTLCGVDIQVALYNVPFLPLLYCLVTIYTVDRIAVCFHAGHLARQLIFAVMILSQPFVLMAVLVNNDMLSVMFGTLALYAALRWYEQRTARNILRAALFFGLGMLSKLSAWMFAVPIALIFLTAWIGTFKQNKKECLGLTGQMAAFLGLAAPLALYWSIRNRIRFGVPIGFIPTVDDPCHEIHEPVLRRLFDFSFWQLQFPYVCYVDANHPEMKIADSYNEFNPLIAVIKSSLVSTHQSMVSDRISLWITILLCIVSFICLVTVCFRKGILSPLHRAVIGSLYLVVLVSFYGFCIAYPQICTEEIRYASPVVFLTVLCTGLIFEKTWHHPKASVRMISKGLLLTAVLYCMVSVYIVTLDGIFFVYCI